MNNNPQNQSNSFKKFLRDKGYYIVLGLCVAAVGVSGYAFVRTATQGNVPINEDTSLSLPYEPNGSGSTAETSAPNTAENKPGTPAPDANGKKPDVAVQTMRPIEGDTTHDYSMDALSYNATTQDWRVHNGIDIAAPVSTEVLAVRDGVVTAIHSDDSLGQTVVLTHEDGYISHYANLGEDVTVSNGANVKCGDVLGTVGDTSISEISQEAHLHFAVTKDNKPVDPEDFLAKS